MNEKRKRVCRIAAGIGLLTLLLSAGSPLRGPDDPLANAGIDSRGAGADAGPRAEATDPVPTPGLFIAKSLFFVYQEFVGPARGGRCPMTPSCSEYGRLAVERYGLGMGILMTEDRIHRCGHDLRFYNQATTSRGVCYEDPPHR